MKKLCVLLLAVIFTAINCLAVFAETPQLPDNNKLLSTKWVQFLGDTAAKKIEVDGQEVYEISGMKAEYTSPGLDIYPSMKELLKDEAEVFVWIVMDIRVVNAEGHEGEEFPFGIKLRPKTTDLTKTEDAFNENYGSEADTFKYTSGNVMTSVTYGKTATEEWQRIEQLMLFVDFDINDEFWTHWYLTFDNMKNYKNGAKIQIRNAGLFLEDDYESVEEKEEEQKEEKEEEKEDNKTPINFSTPAPADIYKPHNFDKYEITFADAIDSEKNGVTVTADNGGTTLRPDGENKKALLYVGITAGLIIIIGAAATVIIIKKKKNKKEDL